MDVNLRVPIGRWRLEEDSAAVGGSGTADSFLASSGFLGLVLEGLGAHVKWVCCVRGGSGGWLLQQAAVDGNSVVKRLNKRKPWA